MKLLTLIFSGANFLVDTVGWLFARLIHFLIQGVTSFCSWGVDKIQSLPENIQIPISAMLIFAFLGIFLACLWAFPHIVFITLIVIPVIIFLLKLFIGWIVLFGLVYSVFLVLKSCTTQLLARPDKV